MALSNKSVRRNTYNYKFFDSHIKKVKQVKLTLIIFLKSNISKSLSWQHVTNIKYSDILQYFFHTKSLNPSMHFTFEYRLVTFQMLKSHKWQVVTALGSVVKISQNGGWGKSFILITT